VHPEDFVDSWDFVASEDVMDSEDCGFLRCCDSEEAVDS
jgi:hypothetical protein